MLPIERYTGQYSLFSVATDTVVLLLLRMIDTNVVLEVDFS